MNSKRNKSTRKRKRDALAIPENQFIAVPSLPLKAVPKTRFSEAAEKAFSKWMKEVSGTEDAELQSRLLTQAASAEPDSVGREIKIL
jgi:hypothetical protein